MIQSIGRRISPLGSTPPRKYKGRGSRPAPQVRLKQEWPAGLFWVLSAMLLLVLAIMACFLGSYALPRYSVTQQVSSVRILFSSPMYCSVNEEEEFRVAVRNVGTDIARVVLLMSTDDACSGFIEREGTNNLVLDEIAAREQVGCRVNAFFPFDFSLHQVPWALERSVGLRVEGTVNGQDFQPLDLPIAIAPVPFHRQFFAWTYRSFLAFSLWVVKEWRDTTKGYSKRAA